MDYDRMSVPADDPAATQPRTTILVVDDDVLISLGTVDMMQDLGYRTLEANSGREALALLAGDTSVGVLITDYAMKDMNGMELARQARALRPGLRVVLATGYRELPGGEECDLPRLDKPFQEADLIACLDAAMARLAQP